MGKVAGQLKRRTDALTRWEGRIKRDLLALSPADIYMDIGAGNGYFTSVILGDCRFWPRMTVLVDCDAKALAQARQYGIVNLIVADVKNLPFREGAFTKVSAFQLLEHVENLPVLFREIARVTGCGGRFVVISPNAKVWSASNPHFFPLFRRSLIKRLNQVRCLSRLFGSFVGQGMTGYEAWKSHVGHLRDGLHEQEFRHLGEGAGFCLADLGTVGQSSFYYYYVDAFNFTFPDTWKLFLGPISKTIVWAEYIATKEWPLLSKVGPTRKMDGVNVYGVFQKV